MTLCDKNTLVGVFFPSKKMSIWASKDPSFQAILNGKRTFYGNSQVGAETLENKADFVISLIFSTLMLLDRMFLNILQTVCCVELGNERRIF